MTIKCQVYSIALIVLSIIGFSSCKTTYKPSNYFQTIIKDTTVAAYNVEDEDAKIRKGDFLDIKITSLNPVEDVLYNSSTINTSVQNGAKTESAAGFYVDKEGNIEVHKLGLVPVEGMTLKQVSAKLVKDLSAYLRDVIVTINFLNHQITILGEIKNPGQIVLNKTDKISIIDALAASGDMTEMGDKKNILIIRTTEKGKQMKRVNLEDHSIFNSEWFYLRSDDVVYVTTSNKKEDDLKRQKQQQIISTISIAASFIVLIYSTFIR